MQFHQEFYTTRNETIPAVKKEPLEIDADKCLLIIIAAKFIFVLQDLFLFKNFLTIGVNVKCV